MTKKNERVQMKKYICDIFTANFDQIDDIQIAVA